MEYIPIHFQELSKLDKELIEEAIKAKNRSYSPYSKFRVGSSLLTADGEIYTGCNIENISFSPTVCAERTAIFKAVSEGKLNISKIAVAVDDKNYCTPCGVCRQVMSEFCSEKMRIFLVNGNNEVVSVSFGELFPGTFQPDSKIGKA